VHESDERPEDSSASGTGPEDAQDAAWREIVANYGERPRLDDEPEQESLAEPPGESQEQPHRPDAEPAAGAADETPERDWFVAEPIDLDGEERYVPPPPPPVDVGSPPRLLAWIAVLGAPVAALLLVTIRALAGLALPPWSWVIVVTAFLAGFGYLVATMPKDPPPPWDDGARV